MGATNRVAMLAQSALLSILTSSVLAQESTSTPPADDADEPQVVRPIEQNRAYRARREKELSRRRPFDTTGIPPGYSPGQWAREMAASDAYDRGYEAGFEEGWRAARQEQQLGRDASLYDAAMAQGVDQFHHGRYGQAARSFVLAAKANQGDPLSRLHGAYAMVALRQYDEAFGLLRRAFQLEPNLTLVPMDLADFYDAPAELAKHIEQLDHDAKEHADDAEVWTLLGFYRFYTDQPGPAHAALRHAAELSPDDAFIRKLLLAARLDGDTATPAKRKSH